MLVWERFMNVAIEMAPDGITHTKFTKISSSIQALLGEDTYTAIQTAK
jgi:hypothetical protein